MLRNEFEGDRDSPCIGDVTVAECSKNGARHARYAQHAELDKFLCDYRLDQKLLWAQGLHKPG